jgi:hypothetical protein
MPQRHRGKMEDEQYLQALLEVLREEDGKLLRSLLKSLSKNKDPSAKRLTEVLIQHPAPHPENLSLRD